MFFDENMNNEHNFIKYNCGYCHNSYYASSTNSVNNCIFCGKSSINKESFKTSDDIYIIPFKKSSDAVIKDFMHKNNFFSPFHKKNVIQNIRKVFVPTICLDASVDGIISFICADRNNKGRYLVDESIFVKYNSVLLPNTQTISEKNIAMVFNYDINNICKYSDDLIGKGYFLIGDKNIDINKSIFNQAVKLCKSNINHDLIKLGNNNNNVDINIIDKKVIYVPMYLIINNYKGVKYYYIMNGENGLSYMNNVYSNTKIIILGLVIFVVVFILLFLLFYFV